MYKDCLKESILVRLSKDIECFWDFTEDLIVDPEIKVSDIKTTFEKIYTELKWSKGRRKGVYFGSVPCGLPTKVGHRFNVEVSIFQLTNESEIGNSPY